MNSAISYLRAITFSVLLFFDTKFIYMVKFSKSIH